MYGVYYHLNNLRLRSSHKQFDVSAAWSADQLKPVVVWFVSNESMKCGLLKCLLDHPMNYRRLP